VLVLQGLIFVVLLTSDTFYGRIAFLQPQSRETR
jgi:simple sugar transport system permease protein